MSGNYAHISPFGLQRLNEIINAPTYDPYKNVFTQLKELLDSEAVFSVDEQERIDHGLVRDLDMVSQVYKEKVVYLSGHRSFTFLYWGFVSVVGILCTIITSGLGVFPLIPISFGFVGKKVCKFGLFGTLMSIVFGLGVMCTLYRYIFKDTFMLLWGVAMKVFETIFSNIWFFFKDCYDFCMALLGNAWDWIKSMLGFNASAHASGETCNVPMCEIGELIQGMGGIFTVKTLGAVLLTVLVALNATHDLVHPNGTRVAIVPKEFASLPTKNAQEMRMVRRAPESKQGPRMEMPLPPYEQKARDQAEYEKKKPDDQSDDSSSWKKFFYGWGIWGVQTVAEHSTMYALRCAADVLYKFFTGNRERATTLIKTVVSLAAGAVSTQFVDDHSYTVTGLAATVVATMAWNVVGWLVRNGFDHIFKTGDAKPTAAGASGYPNNPVREMAEKRASNGGTNPGTA